MGLVVTPDTLSKVLRELDLRLRILEGTNLLAAGATIGPGTALTQVSVYSPSLTPSSVGANSTSAQTFTVTGLATTDKVLVNGPAVTAGVAPVEARVSADNTLQLIFANVTPGSLTPASGTYLVVAIRS